MSEVKDQKDAKDAKSKDREKFLKQAEELGIKTEGLTDEQLLFKVISELNKSTSQLAATLSSKDTKSVGNYISGIQTKIKDQDFLIRLMNMSVPSFYLHLFEDEDEKRSDKDIWGIINKSGINPITNLGKEIGKNLKHPFEVFGHTVPRL